MEQHSSLQILVEPNPEDVEDEIERNLVASLRTNVPPNDALPLAVVARDGGGKLVAGLIGSTSYGWLLIKMLWVMETFRNHGLGTEIMERAEKIALQRGCHGAWLDTSSERASRFYARLGYRPFGMLENKEGDHPEGHCRFFLSKRLLPETPDKFAETLISLRGTVSTDVDLAQ
jgi:GNAT superfamily N-acetyltransferase